MENASEDGLVVVNSTGDDQVKDYIKDDKLGPLEAILGSHCPFKLKPFVAIL